MNSFRNTRLDFFIFFNQWAFDVDMAEVYCIYYCQSFGVNYEVRQQRLAGYACGI